MQCDKYLMLNVNYKLEDTIKEAIKMVANR